MTRCSILGVGLFAPGLESFGQAQSILRGERPYTITPLPPATSNYLPRNERRRTTNTIRLAMTAAQQAVENAALDPAGLATVFSTSSGDIPLVDSICSTLASSDRALSPTQFHNSVHNAPAGYWSIATDASGPSTSVGAYDSSFTAGLLEAAILSTQENRNVLFVTYEQTMPTPFRKVRPITEDCAVSLILGTPAEGKPSIELTLASDAQTVCTDPELESLRTHNPAAKALPLLVALAKAIPSQVILPYLDSDNSLSVTYIP